MNTNGMEIELKFVLNETPEMFIKRFDNTGNRIYQKTVMFDNEQGLMQKTNGRVRLRQTGESVSLSYKLPISSETVKKEIE
jgi:adenylate cyclase class IV